MVFEKLSEILQIRLRFFFYFDEISKLWILEPKNVFPISLYKTRVFSPGAPKNQNYDEKFYRHAHMAQRNNLTLFLS